MNDPRRSTDDGTKAGYEIRLKGHLDSRWAAWFDGLSLRHETDGTTVIHGPVADQAALHGLLLKIRDAGMPLVSLTCVPADQPPDPAYQASTGSTHARQGDPS